MEVVWGEGDVNAYVASEDVKEEFGVDDNEFDNMLLLATPRIYEKYLYGKKYILQDAYEKLKAEYMKKRHKKAAYRQAIGLIAVWDCFTHDESTVAIAKRWSRFLGTRITPDNVSELVYRFVDLRERLHMAHRRPNDEDFAKTADAWSLHLKTKINPKEVEFMLSSFVEMKDFFEPCSA